MRHPRPEEVAIERPRDRFKKISEERYEWEFNDLEPTLADDLKIVAHRGYVMYNAAQPQTTDEPQPWRGYVFQGEHYFLEHADCEAVASSTLPPAGKHKYDIKNIQSNEPDLTWAEGIPGDGIDESITLEVARPLPLDTILVMPGYVSLEDPSR